MDWTHKRVGSVDVMVVRGRLDTDASHTFTEALLAVAARVEGRLVLDLAEVDYVVSMTLRGLPMAARQLQPNGSSLVLASVQPLVQQVLDIAGLSRLFRCYSTSAAAIDDLGEPLPFPQPQQC